MGAHLRPLNIACDEPGCTKLAREELRNTYNAVLGKFCALHARRWLAELRAGERSSSKQPRSS